VRIATAEALWSISGDAHEVMPTLVSALADDDRQIRMRALRQLTALGPQANLAIEPLRALRNDKRPQVRRIAAEALKKIEDSR
jgi:HEAT repeat protein